MKSFGLSSTMCNHNCNSSEEILATELTNAVLIRDIFPGRFLPSAAFRTSTRECALPPSRCRRCFPILAEQLSIGLNGWC